MQERQWWLRAMMGVCRKNIALATSSPTCQGRPVMNRTNIQSQISRAVFPRRISPRFLLSGCIWIRTTHIASHRIRLASRIVTPQGNDPEAIIATFPYLVLQNDDSPSHTKPQEIPSIRAFERWWYQRAGRDFAVQIAFTKQLETRLPKRG